MNKWIKYTPIYTRNRDHILDYLKEKQYKRVIDVGASANSWAKEYMSHYFDIHITANSSNKKGFIGSVCHEENWFPILKDVEENGKFDFAICTHTLEDICNPNLVATMLSKIAKEGFNAVPSKYAELNKQTGQYKGWPHHRWIFNKEDKDIVAYPKLNLIEYAPSLDQIALLRDGENEELQWFWQEKCIIKFINNDYLGPCLMSLYNKLID